MKTIGACLLVFFLGAALVFLMVPAGAPVPTRSESTNAAATTADTVVTIVVPPSVELGSLDSSSGVLRGNFLLKNPNNFPVINAEITCRVISASGEAVGTYTFTIYESITANGSKAMNRYQFGEWPQQGRGLRCNGNKAVKR
jgi:hypothetical protein